MALRSLIIKIGADTQAIDKALSTVGASSKNLAEGLKKLGDTPIGKQAQQDAERLQKTIDAVRASQERLANSAKLTAQGIAAIGGPAKLTKNELDQMNRTLQQGLDAFRALGQQAPKELQKVADAVAKQQKALQSSSVFGGGTGALLKGAVPSLPGGGLLTELGAGGVAAGLAAGASAGAVAFAAAAHSALEYADSLTKISDKTSIGTEALQRLESIAIASGNSLDQVSAAVSQFQNRIASGDKSATAALNEIGTSIKEIRSLSADQQFIAIAHGIQTIKDPADQTRIAMDLFGRSGAELLPSLKANVDALRDSTVVMSAESVAALDRAGDAWTKFVRDSKVSAGIVIGSIAQEFERREKDLRELQLKADLARGQRTADITLAPGPTLPKAQPFQINGLTATAEFDKQFGTIEAQLAKAVAASDAILEQHRKTIAALGQELSGGNALAALRDLEAAWRAQPRAIQENPLAIARVVAAYRPLAAQLAPNALPRDFEILRLSVDASTKKFDGLIAIVPQLAGFTDELRLSLQGLTADGSLAAAEGFDILAAAADHLVDAEKTLAAQHQRTAAILANATANQPFIGQPNVQPSGTLDGLDDEAKEATHALRDLSDMFVRLEQASGGSLGQILSQLGQMIVLLEGAQQATQQLGKPDQFGTRQQLGGNFGYLSVALNQQATASQRSAAAVTSAAAITQGAMNVWSATSSHRTTAGNAGAGALAGAQAGAAFGPYGIAIGAAAGLIVGLIRGKPEWAKAADEIGRDFGVEISDGLAKEIEKSSKKLGGDRQAGILSHLSDIIGEAGGVKNFGFQKAVEGAHDLFSLLETGRLTVREVGEEFDKVFAQLIPEAVSKVSGLVSASFVDLQKTALSFGTESPALEVFRSSQTDQITGALDAFFRNVQIKSQSAATALGSTFAAQFAELSRQGVPLLDIINQMAPSIEAFRRQLQKTGFDGGAAFQNILGLADVLKDKIAGPALQSLSALGKVLAGLANTGGLTQDIFGGFSDQIGRTVAELISKGIDPAKITQLLAPTLQQLFELQERGFVITDEITKQLLADAIAQGKVGQQFKSASERTVDGLKDANKNLSRTNTILEAIANKLGAKVVNPPAPKAPGGPGDKGPPPTQPAATGGYVTPYGIQHFAHGGTVTPVIHHRSDAFMEPQHLAGGGQVIRFTPRGTDTVPAMLTPGEVVLTRGQQSAIARSIIDPTKRLPHSLEVILRQFQPRLGQAASSTPRQFSSGGVVPSFAATGGQVAASGVQVFADGGRVLPFLSKGVDAAAALVTPETVVLDFSQQQAIDQTLSSSHRPIHLQAEIVMNKRVVGEAALEYAAGEGRQKSHTITRRSA